MNVADTDGIKHVSATSGSHTWEDLMHHALDSFSFAPDISELNSNGYRSFETIFHSMALQVGSAKCTSEEAVGPILESLPFQGWSRGMVLAETLRSLIWD